jgi:hypothetical protein
VFEALLFLLPAIAVFAPLLARRYPGERAVLRLRGRAAVDRKPSAPIALAPRAPLARAATRGSLLMGRSLAVRPPPLPAFAG